MKIFLFSILVLTLLIAVIVWNSFYVKDVTQELLSALQTLPACSQAAEQAQALKENWKSEEHLLKLSVPDADIKEIGNALTELCVAARFQDEKAFERARALCFLGIARIRDLERFSLLHIL